MVFTMPCTAFSFDAEHTATLASCSNASPNTLNAQSQRQRTSFTSSKNISVFLRCSFSPTLSAPRSVTLFHGSPGLVKVVRHAPFPPRFNNPRGRATFYSVEPNSLNVLLNVTRCPSRSVSHNTPSQSNNNASG